MLLIGDWQRGMTMLVVVRDVGISYALAAADQSQETHDLFVVVIIITVINTSLRLRTNSIRYR